ncbi:MAG: aspartate--tRNA ligase [Spirochaetes bacterium]|nr:aspartate--tRNA ligase [Spirochaetota bacterium]
MFKDRSYCGEVGKNDVGKYLTFFGWVARKRDLGGIIFIELRDVTGYVQLVVDSSKSEAHIIDTANQLRNEYCIMAKGEVRLRSPETINPSISTGEIEIFVTNLEILSVSEVPPFQISTAANLSEEVRLKYRYLDLRRSEMQEAIIIRHRVCQAVRNYLSGKRFIEIETPMLNKSTPEGARDFLVPSRINKGMFYALPQSPQLFKQILMVSGFDRYFQIVKCFRDEDLRNDRQPEFTQVDLEMSFVDPPMVMEVIEGLLAEIVKVVLNKEIEVPFQRITYDEAMDRFGKDAPDLRFGLELVEVSDIFKSSKFEAFATIIRSGGKVKTVVVPQGARVSRKMIDDYSEFVKIYKAKGLYWARYKSGSFDGGISKYLSESEQKELEKRTKPTEDSLLFFVADFPHIVNDALGNLRLRLGKELNLCDDNTLKFVWVTDFPLLEYHEEDKRFYAKHHPFTAPKREHYNMLDTISPENVDELKAQAYDVVLNGVEIGGGSIRIFDPQLQKKMFALLSISEEEAKVKFSFLLDAFKYGPPPHGGIALGLDRILMILLKRTSIRDVIAFPKTQKGQCLMSEAPSYVSPEQLEELAIRIIDNERIV